MRRILIYFVLTGSLIAQPGKRDKRDLEVAPAPVDKAAPAVSPTVTIPRSYALVIGISKYQNLNEKENLEYAERDAESMFSVLISQEGGNFKAENVRRLIGPRATLANIKKELEEWLPSVTKDDDRVLIFFAGHGFVVRGIPYLAPYDIRRDDVPGTAYPMETLGTVFGSRIKGKWKVLLTDACHSGAIGPESRSAFTERMLVDLKKSIFVLSASRDREESYESTDWGGGHGVFTYFVQRGMSGAADQNEDGIVTADELEVYVRNNVREATGTKQNPTSRPGFDPQMLLAWTPSSSKPDAPPPPKFGAMIIEVNQDGVEVFVNGKSVGVVNKGKPLKLPGLAPGAHSVQGVKMGFKPDGPREEMIYPGQETTVTIRIRFPVSRPKAAVDELNRGIESYQKGYQANYLKAVEHLKRALAADPTYSEAALYLGRVYHALDDDETGATWFRKAIDIDKDYVEARVSLAGLLLDKGDADEAIRQVDAAIQRDKNNGVAHYILAGAYRQKSDYAQSIDAAREAIRLMPRNAESRFWLAESLRKMRKFSEARREYRAYLQLSDFDTKAAGQFNYWVRGFIIGGGRKSRASVKDIWKDLRSLAYFGVCDCDRLEGRYDEAIEQCRLAIRYDPDNVYNYYALGMIHQQKAQQKQSLELLATASKYFRSALDVNAHIPEAAEMRAMLESNDELLKAN